MKKSIFYTLVILIILTIITALISNLIDLKIAAFFILVLSILKFIFVAFQFMELKKGHVIWKVIILGFLTIFLLIILIVLN